MKTTKRSRLLQIISIILSVLSYSNLSALSTTWTGVVNTSWTGAGNWTAGVPGVNDTVVFNTSVANNPLLSGNTTIYRLVMQTDTFDLNGNTLVVTGSSTLSGGMITNGALDGRGTSVTFSGSVVNVTVTVAATAIYFNGSVFNYSVAANVTGSTTNTSNGGSVFNSTFSIINSGGATLNFANSSRDTYEGDVTITDTLSGSVNMAKYDTSFFNGNIYVNAYSTSGGITFGSGAGSFAKLKTGKTISAGSNAFAGGTLALKGFIQSGSTSQSITLTGSAVLSVINASFEGALSCSAPGVLLKNNTFNGAVIVTKTDSITNAWYGGNTFSGKFRLTNAGNGIIALQTNSADFFNDSATFNAGSGRITGAKSGTTVLNGNLYTTGSNFDFSSGTGTYKFSGSAYQLMKGSVELVFTNFTIDKSSGTLTLQAPVKVNTLLTLTKGIIITDTTNIITIAHGGSCGEGGSDTSFISGPIKKIGDAFIFPVGKGNEYNPISISAPSSTDAFVAEYFHSGQAVGDSMVDSLKHIFDCFYWGLRQTSGTTNIYVTLGWDTAYCNLYDTTLLQVTMWEGNRWVDLGHGALTGSYKGTLTSAISSIQSYYLAFGSPLITLLPTLVAFSRNVDHYYGISGKNIYLNKDHDWRFKVKNTTTDNETLISNLQGLYPAIIRFNAGGPGNFFDWHNGWFFSDEHLYQYNQYLRDKCFIYNSSNQLFSPPNDYSNPLNYNVLLDKFKRAIDFTGALPIFELSMNASTIDYQLALLIEARRLNIRVAYVELGTELYLPDEGLNVIAFPDGVDYGKKCYEWTRRIKEALGEDVNVAVCVNDLYDLSNPRRNDWNKLLIPQLKACEDHSGKHDGPDAIVFHQYIHKVVANGKDHKGEPVPSTKFNEMFRTAFSAINTTTTNANNTNTFKCLFDEEMEDIKTLYPNRNYEIWMTEYGLDEREWMVHGTWAAGLFTALQTLLYLENTDITMAVDFSLWSNCIWGDIFVDENGFFNDNNDPDHQVPFPSPGITPKSTITDEYSSLGHAMKHIGKAFQKSQNVQQLDFGSSVPTIGSLHNSSGPVDIPALLGFYFSDELTPPPTYNEGKQMIILNISNHAFIDVDLSGFGDWTNYDLTSGNAGDFVLGLNGINGIECMDYLGNMGSDLNNEIGETINIVNHVLHIPPYSIVRIYNCRVPPLTLTVSADHICSGNDVTINLITPIENGWSFIWDNSNTSETFRHESPSNSSCTSTVYNYTVTVTDGCQNPSTATKSVSVTVMPAVEIEITSNAAGPLCPGDPVTLTAADVNSYGCHNDLSFVWITGDGDGISQYNNAANDNITVDPEYTTEYIAYGLYDFTSPLMQCASMASLQVMTDPPPLDLPTDTIVCEGETIHLVLPQYDNLDNGIDVDDYTFTWTVDNSAGPSTPGANYFNQTGYFSSGIHTLEVSVYNNATNSCTLNTTITVYASECCDNSIAINAGYNHDGEGLRTMLDTQYDGTYTFTDNTLTIDLESFPTLEIPVNGKWTPDYSVITIRGRLGMSEGAQIEISPHLKIYSQGTMLHACTDKLWRGIRLNNRAICHTDIYDGIYSKINDAEYAVTACHFSILNLNKTKFDKNYVSLYVPPATQFPVNVVTGSNNLNHFTCIDCSDLVSPTNLLDPYTGQIIVTGNNSFAGMELHDVALNVDDATIGEDPTTFENLNNGIIALNSSLMVKNTTFENIRNYDPGTNTMPMNATPGTGIFSGSEKYNVGFLYQWGLGKTSSTPTFSNCRTAIFSSHSNIESSENKMESVIYGYRLDFLEYYHHADIFNNDIQALYYGASLHTNDFCHDINIHDNQITIDDAGGNPNVYRTGIGIWENNFPSLNYDNRLTITNNIIDLGSNATLGISMYNVRDALVNDNAINLNSTDNYGGISLNYSFEPKIACNSITGQSAADHTYAIGTLLTPGGMFSCNTTDKTLKGIYFDTDCSNTILQGNEIKNHDIGLEVGGSLGQISQQYHLGNRWTGIYTTKGALHNYLPFASFQPIKISTTSPLGAADHETTRIPLNWIQVDNTILDYACSTATSPCFEIDRLRSFNSIDSLVAIGSISIENYEDELNYISDRQLYERCALSNVEIPNVIDSFYTANENTNIGKLYLLSTGMESLNSLLYDYYEFIRLKDSINSIMLRQIDTNNTLIMAGGPDSLILIEQNNSLLGLISGNMIQSNEALVATDSIINYLADSLTTENSNITPANDLEDYEKEVNTIYFSKIARKLALDATDTTNINAIASLCILEGGIATFKARGIRALYSDTIIYDDYTNCLSGGSPRIGSSKTSDKNSVSIHPNPANESITIDMHHNADGIFKVEITDPIGNVIYNRNTTFHSGLTSLNTLTFRQGIYYIKVTQEENQISTGRFLIIR